MGESEISIQQMDNMTEIWAMRILLIMLCMIHWCRGELNNFFLAWNDNMFFWYLGISPTIGLHSLVMGYIGFRGHGHWYQCFTYLYILGDGEGFKVNDPIPNTL